MKCSQCQIGRAWDAQGRCRPCSIGNVNLGAPLTPGEPAAPAPPAPGIAPVGPDSRTAAPPVSTRSRGGACSQCWVGVAWDEEGRCRPCSEGGVRLAPAAVQAADAEGDAEAEAGPRPRPGGRLPRRWFGDRGR